MNKILKSLLRISFGVFCILLSAYCFIARPSFNIINKQAHSENNIEIQKLQDHVYALSETFAPRSVDHPENLKNAGFYVRDEFLKSTKNVELQKFNFKDEHYFNVIAKMGNLDSKDIILVGAHYDGFSDLPGADDNASGTAGLIELAHLLKNKKLNKQIHFIAYTTEEPPFFASKFMGSYIHAQSIKNENIELMINLEMIGYYSDEKNSQKYPLKSMEYIYPTKGNFIAVVEQFGKDNARHLKNTMNQVSELPVYSINAPSHLPGLRHSDHRNYWDENINAVMVTNTSMYRNFNYHTEEDTYDKLNYEKMASVVYGVYHHLLKLDN